MAWVAAPVIAWAIHSGRRAGALAAVAVGAADAAVRGWRGDGFPPQVSINATVLLLLAGVITGYMSRLAGDAQRRLQEAAEREAATRERERLARGIHDSVLQVLALVQRRGAEMGGEAAQLGRLAGEQEATLRALVAGGATGPAGDPARSGAVAAARAGTADRTVDLLTLLSRYASPDVTIAAPAEPVKLPAAAATELAAATGSALDNVRVHCAPHTRAWILVEAEPEAVTVTVRDKARASRPGGWPGRPRMAGSASPSRAALGEGAQAVRVAAGPGPDTGHPGSTPPGRLGTCTTSTCS